MKVVPYEKNAKIHPDKQLKQIAKSIKEFGWQQKIIVDKEGVIIVGHGRWFAYEKYKDEMDLPKPEIKQAGNLTKEQVKAYRLADNKLNESAWDLDLAIDDLKELSDEMFDLTGFDKDLLIEGNEMDDVLPENPPAKANRGDIWQLGRHRVMCGDSTNKEDVERLMGGILADLVITDPPYNTGMEGKDDKKAWLSYMFKDSFTDEDYLLLLQNSFKNNFDFTKGQCAFYIFIDWRKVGLVRQELENLMDVKNVIVWDKKVHGLGSDYKFTYEMVVVGKKGKPVISNRFGLDYQDIWRLQREMGRNTDHSTAKPIELLEKPIKHASKEDDIVLDLFLGSGSTLIACEKTNRIAFGMEIDEHYCDIIIQRYENYTGNKAIKIS